jgi:hypothetical protein
MTTCAIVSGGMREHFSPDIAIVEGSRARNEEWLLLLSDKIIDHVILKKYDQSEYITLSAEPLAKNIKKTFGVIE